MNPKVSVIILTKDRELLFPNAVRSVLRQVFSDFELIIVNDGSKDKTVQVINNLVTAELSDRHRVIINHKSPVGITKSRQEALEKSSGELVAFLDDDDEWIDPEKLSKQVQWFERNPDGVVCGGGIKKISNFKFSISNKTAMRPESDFIIRKWMLLKNPFFTSTVMFKKSAATRVGGFLFDGIDLAEDYDLWLRMGKIGKLYNFQEVFTAYRVSEYNKVTFQSFLNKQLRLVQRNRADYPYYFLARLILYSRIIFSKIF